MDDIARTKRIPTCGSANWTNVLLPNQVTVPSPPLLKSPATGTTVKTRSAGIREKKGANLKTNLSALFGIKSSLKNSFIPSASV